MSAERSVSRRLAEAMDAIAFASLPPEVVVHARRLIVDTRMVALAGAVQPDVAAVAALTRATGGVPQSRLWACGTLVPAADAAFVNALAASALDYDSLHDNVHPDAIVLPVAWSVASAMHRSGEDFLRAFVLGSELVCRLAESVEGPQKGWTIGAVVGTFGAAFAAALPMKLSPAQIAHALGLCLSMAAGSQQTNVEQVLAKRLQPALAARAGVQASLLAGAGVTAPQQAFEGRFGLWTLYFPGDRARLFDGLGERYAMLRTGFKRYPVCACSHAAIDALQGALGAAGIAPRHADRIARIEAVISPFMARLVGGPFQPDANPQVTAQFSLQYALASIATRGRLGIAELSAHAVRETAIARMVERVVLAVDEGNAGELAPATVRVHLASGECIERRVDAMPGSADAPLTDAQLRAKVIECAGSGGAARPTQVADALLERAQTLEHIADIAAVAI